MNFLLTTTFQSFRRGWFTVLLLLSGVPFFPCFFNPLALRALPLSHLRWAEGEGKSVALNGLFVLWAFSYISLRHIGGEGWYLDTFSLLRIFFNPSVTMCHLPLYFALQNAGEESRNLSITWFYCFYSPSVLPRSILCVATPVRLDTAREECVNVLQRRGV